MPLSVNRCSDRLRDGRVEQVRSDRCHGMEIEQKHEDGGHQGSAADAGHADEHADEEACHGIERIVGGEESGSH